MLVYRFSCFFLAPAGDQGFGEFCFLAFAASLHRGIFLWPLWPSQQITPWCFEPLPKLYYENQWNYQLGTGKLSFPKGEECEKFKAPTNHPLAIAARHRRLRDFSRLLVAGWTILAYFSSNCPSFPVLTTCSCTIDVAILMRFANIRWFLPWQGASQPSETRT